MNSVTVTAYAGPGILATAQEITDVTGVNFNFQSGVLEISTSSSPSPMFFELASVATVTFSISGQNYTITVS